MAAHGHVCVWVVHHWHCYATSKYLLPKHVSTATLILMGELGCMWIQERGDTQVMNRTRARLAQAAQPEQRHSVITLSSAMLGLKIYASTGGLCGKAQLHQ